MSTAGVECPFCAGRDTEMLSLFGQQLMTAQYYCRTCHTPFERVKGDDVLDDAKQHARRADVGGADGPA